MGFVKFTEVGKNYVPQAIMWPSGIISFNQGARKKYSLDIYSHTVMYMNPDDHTVAFEFVHDENLEGANRARHIRDAHLDINARPFLDHFKLRVKRPLSFRIEEDSHSGWIILSLDHGQIVHEKSSSSIAGGDARVDGTKAKDAKEDSGRLKDVGRTAAEAALKTLAGTVPANGDNQDEKPVVQKELRAVGGAAPQPPHTQDRRARGVKAMLSEFLQDS